MPQPLIEIQALYKTYSSKGGNVPALEDIHLTIDGGDIFGIIGLSGAGKSTLVRCLNFLEKPTSGTVRIDGVDLSSLTPAGLRELRRSVGMIFQQFNLMMQRTALQNVLFPLELQKADRKKSEARARELLELVGLADRAGAYPAELSGGQKQRVAIARALATGPKVLLCDEATSALDPTTTASILSLLKQINRELGLTVVIITHEMRVIESICNRVAIIDAHRIAECGPVEEIFNRPRSEAARRLILPREPARAMAGKRCIRIVFDGSSSFEPVVAGLVLEFRTPINILFADTKNVGGHAHGQMVVQLPEEEPLAERMIRSLSARGLTVEEAEGYVE
ncbi:MAG: ATP-binding cassette domain-containing protein [Provencibacterium sp.]|jgi:D-methionine transport system ATP-binding protein|nr:ATP-binding cassette domain-containing protein [Provencibacterium sp.]